MIFEDYLLFLENLSEIINNSDLDNSLKLLDSFSLFISFIDQILISENQFFPSNLSKFLFINRKSNIEDSVIDNLIKLIKINKKLLANPTYKLNDIRFENYLYIIKNYVSLIFNQDIINNISIDEEIDPTPIKYLNNLQVVGKKKNSDILHIYCLNSLNQKFILEIRNSKLFYLDELIWKNCILNAINFDFKIDDLYISNINSLVVLNPNYLLDVTELAECFNRNSSNYFLSFLKKFDIKTTSTKAVLGNFINYCFDELIIHSISDYELLFKQFTKTKPLAVFAIFHKSPNEFNILKSEGKTIFEKLKKNIKKLDLSNYSIEPSFISSKYGIQGRLDLLLENNSEKNIIELKSGRAPNTDFGIAFEENSSFNTGMWINHYAQIMGYSLLLESAYENRKGYSSILYANDEINPIRNAPDNSIIKFEILKLRNQIISVENAILNFNFSIFKNLNSKIIKNLPSFSNDFLNHFESIYNKFNEIEIDYLNYFYFFTLKENYINKIGTNSTNGFSSLWLNDTFSFKTNYNFLFNCKLNLNDSNLNELHLIFNIDSKLQKQHSFRKGDPVILFKIIDEKANPIMDKINKGIIKNIDQTKIKISLRNKQTDLTIFNDNSVWNIYPDLMDTSSKYSYQAIFKLLNSNKKNLILGLESSSTFQNNINIEYFILNHCVGFNKYQIKTLKNALYAKDYYLIQGPPGTGKTSFIISALANYYNLYSNENVLLLAYTNRAVDGLCYTLKKLNIDFIRIGSKESTDLPEYSFYNLAENSDLNYLYKKIQTTRFIVSTTTSFQTNFEISELKKFSVAIVDEASQILEPQIVGILSEVEKFILVGDERQLPAVVLQENQSIDFKNLKLIELNELSNSFFSRLLKVCQKNGWEHSFSSLIFQSRMHIDIQDIANIMFYTGILKADENNIRQYSKNQFYKSENLAFNEILKNRVIFVDIPIDKNIKSNLFEVEIINLLINEIAKYNILKSDSIGIISPFKNQCFLLQNELNNDLTDYLSIDTIERFQGSERDCIILSLASNSKFYLDRITSKVSIDDEIIDRKLNVSITRSKEYCIIVGNKEVLSNDPIYLKMISYIKSYHFYINYNDLKKVLDN